MSRQVLRRAALLSFILLCAAVESPPRAPAAQGAAPQTMQGVYRYRVRGLTAGTGAFSGMIKAQATGYAAMHRIVPGFFKILGGMAKVSNDPSAKEMHNFLRSADRYGVDFSTIPIAAGYGVEIEFTLELVNKEWRLKRGSYRWSSDHHWSFSAGEGSIMENVRGQGDGTLDPKTSSITLVDIGKKGSPRMELAGNILITSGFMAGKSVYTNGPIRWAIDHGKGEVEIVMGGLAAIREKLPGANEPAVGNFSFSKSGPPERAMKGTEVYQDLLDSGVVEEWELWDDCDAVIKSPKDWDELAYNDKEPGQLEHVAFASVRPTFWGDDLHWILPQISGSKLEPENAVGNNLEIVYTNLPKRNSAFGKREVRAEFGPKAKAAGCKDPQPIEASYFFPRRSTNNPGPGVKAAGNPEMEFDPNWFYYWGQTSAAQGRSAELRYGGSAEDCETPIKISTEIIEGEEIINVTGGPIYGYAGYGDPYVVICDLGKLFFSSSNPYAQLNTEGIDTYAVTVIHELEHHDNYRKWWRAGYSEELDDDNDDIPDLLEGTIRIPPPLNTKHTFFDPQEKDTVGEGEYDEHYLAWMAEARWKVLSAEDEDWACPGQQTGKCQE